MSKEIIVFATGESIMDFKLKINDILDKYDTLAWGNSLTYVHKWTKRFTKYYSFIDPHSALDSLKLLKSSKDEEKTTILVLGPIVNTDMQQFRKFLRSTSMKTNYQVYTDTLKKACKKHNQLIIKSQTIKSLKQDKHELASKDLDDKDAELRFKYPFIVMGMKSRLDFKKDDRTKNMNLYENKLTMCILPLLAKMKYEKVYLIGFDGKGGRWFDKKLKNKDDVLNRTYAAFLPKWKEWKKYTNMEVFNLVRPPKSNLDKWLPKKNLNDLLS